MELPELEELAAFHNAAKEEAGHKAKPTRHARKNYRDRTCSSVVTAEGPSFVSGSALGRARERGGLSLSDCQHCIRGEKIVSESKASGSHNGS